MTTDYFHNIPNTQALGYTIILAVLLSGLLIRALYWFSDHYRQYHYTTPQVYLAVIGKQWLTRLSFCTVVLMALLAFRITSAMYGQYTSNFIALQQFSIGWWCVIRILLCALASLSSCLYDSNMYFRVFCIVSYPVLAMLDMLSELSLMQHYNCIVNGTCTRIQSQYTFINWMMWRDLASAILNLTCLAMCCWLLAVYGWRQNRLYLPKLEHRMVSKRLQELNIDRNQNQRNKKKYVS